MKRALLLLGVAACGSSTKTTDQPAKGPVLAVQAAVEGKILPAVIVRGDDVHYTLEERMAKHKVPGLSIAVFDNYQLVWAKAYGVADVETGAKVTESTLFQAGSISKSVNALAVMMEVGDGTFDLDEPINTYLQTWKLPDNDLTRASPVTLRRLLSHTAGTTVHGFPGYATGAAVPTIVQILDGLPPANTAAIRVDLAPGKEFRYSGGGTTITQLALADTLGAAYPQIAHERVLAPLGMIDSTYEQPLPPARVEAAAAGHHRDGKVVPTKRHVYPEMAAAGLWTTASDLARFFSELALARAGKSSKIPAELAKQMTSVVVKTHPDDKGGVGLGVFIQDRNGVLTFGHGGADEGFQADAVASLDGGYGIVVMANSDNGFRLFGEIERTVFAAMGWPGADPVIDRFALEPAQRNAFAGTYAGTRVRPFRIAVDGERLELHLAFRDPVELVPIAADSVASTDQPIVYKLAGDGLEIGRDGQVFGKVARTAAGQRVPLIELEAGRFDEAVAGWKAEVATDAKAGMAIENELNNIGYELLGEGRTDAAVLVLRAVVAVFPDSSNAYDSLGEAQMAAGQKAEAIASYEKSIALLDGDARLPAELKATRRQHAEAQLAKLRAK